MFGMPSSSWSSLKLCKTWIISIHCEYVLGFTQDKFICVWGQKQKFKTFLTSFSEIRKSVSYSEYKCFWWENYGRAGFLCVFVYKPHMRTWFGGQETKLLK